MKILINYESINGLSQKKQDRELKSEIMKNIRLKTKKLILKRNEVKQNGRYL